MKTRMRGMFPQVYHMVNGEPIETHEGNGFKIEIHNMNDYPEIVAQMIMSRSQFSMWTTPDHIDYKLLVENGFKEKIKPLFAHEPTLIHAQYFKTLDEVATKHKSYMRFIPLGMIVIFFISMITPQEASLPILMASLLGMIVSSIVLQKIFNTRRTNARNEALIEMQKSIGGETKYDDLMKAQRTYIDEYFEKYYAEQDALAKKENEGKSLEDSNNEKNSDEINQEDIKDTANEEKK